MSKFKEGNPGKPKGAISKVNQEAKELFNEILSNESEHIASAFIELRKESPFRYLQTILKLSSLIIPKPTEATVNFYEHEPFKITDIFKVDRSNDVEQFKLKKLNDDK